MKRGLKRKGTAECMRYKSKLEEYWGCKSSNQYKNGRAERRDDGGRINQDKKHLVEACCFILLYATVIM